MVLVPANMSRLSFGPCKKKICFWSLQNFLFFKITKFFVGTCLKKQNILQGPKTTKWVQSSCATYANHNKNGVRDYFKKQKILQRPKTFFFCRDQNLNKAYLQGRVQYLSLKKFLTKPFSLSSQTAHLSLSGSTWVPLALVSLSLSLS